MQVVNIYASFPSYVSAMGKDVLTAKAAPLIISFPQKYSAAKETITWESFLSQFRMDGYVVFLFCFKEPVPERRQCFIF